MNQDVLFFVVTSLIVVALVIIGPVFVLWRYQRGGTVETSDASDRHREIF